MNDILTVPAAHRVWLRPELVSRVWWIVVVVGVMLGPPIVSSAFYGLRHASGDFLTMMRDRTLMLDGAVESSLLGLFLITLHRCGWRPADLRIRLDWTSTAQGFGLLFLTYVGLAIVVLPVVLLPIIAPYFGHVAALAPKLVLPHPGTMHLSWPVIIVFTFVNAFYEELVYMGFTFNQVSAKVGVNWAVVITVLIRLSIHTYQGWSHVLQIGTWALIYGLFYRWRGRVWPLILAHATMDFISLGALKVIFG